MFRQSTEFRNVVLHSARCHTAFWTCMAPSGERNIF